MSKRPMKNKEDERKTPDKALILHPLLPCKKSKDSIQADHALKNRDLHNQLEEAEGLARAIHLEILECLPIKITRINPGTLFGKGATEEVNHLVEEQEPDIVIVNHDLSPVQQRNLERAWNIKVIDRTGLILEIFGERAQTKEGKIQVELAALEYQRSRLVRSWTHLERQRGGAGFMGGPGETQIELDRRIIGDRIVKLKKELDDVRRTRDLARKSRERVPFPVVALVGYTNAGKSTLFNRMTGADVLAKDLLFATLDPTMRKVRLDNGQDFILSDTVGFISNLPTTLVAAFRSTLEQVQYADVILHIRDISQEDTETHKKEVMEIMKGLGIGYDEDPRIIEVLNKIDLVNDDERQDILRKAKFNDIKTVTLSAITGEGEKELLEAIQDVLTRSREILVFRITPSDGEAISWLYNHGTVIIREDQLESIDLHVELSPADIARFEEKFPYKAICLSKEKTDKDSMAL